MTEEDNNSPETENSKDNNVANNKGKDKKDKGIKYSKIVCRRLPPTMNEETFLEQVSPIPEHDYFYFAKPDMTLTPDLFSRAYINFVNVEDIFLFRDKFDDYIFLDEKGNEYPAIVEYAPFQRIPKKRRKKDPKSGLLESDPTYLEFLESLKETDSDCREPKMEYSFQLTEEKKETTTPLLEFLATRRREEKRRKEERQKRRIRNRNPKEEDIIEEEVKKIKPRDFEKSKDTPKSLGKKKEDEAVNLKSQQMDSKDKSNTKSYKSYRESKKSSEDSRKKGDTEKKEYKSGKIGDAGEVKLNRKERRERQREAAASKVADKGKELKRIGDLKKDKTEGKTLQGSFRQIDETEQDEILSLTIESKGTQKLSDTSPVDNENPKSLSPLVSSNIKPFTQLPQYKMEELSKVIEEMDKNIIKKKVDDESVASSEKKDIFEKMDGDKIKVTSNEELSNCNNIEKFTESSVVQQRRNSLESGDVKPSSEESSLRRHKSLDDKSQDDSSGKEGTEREKTCENKKDRRLRNKDRPSMAIYQPGMGRFSKQRIDRGKDSSTGSNP